MSSPLDGRIRVIAREELEAFLPRAASGSSAPNAAGLQQQITDLHEHLHLAVVTAKRLEERLDVLEAAVRDSDTTETAPRRARRKTAEQ